MEVKKTEKEEKKKGVKIKELMKDKKEEQTLKKRKSNENIEETGSCSPKCKKKSKKEEKNDNRHYSTMLKVKSILPV